MVLDPSPPPLLLCGCNRALLRVQWGSCVGVMGLFCDCNKALLWVLLGYLESVIGLFCGCNIAPTKEPYAPTKEPCAPTKEPDYSCLNDKPHHAWCMGGNAQKEPCYRGGNAQKEPCYIRKRTLIEPGTRASIDLFCGFKKKPYCH